VTVRLAPVLSHEPRTLWPLLRHVADAPSLSGTSRFLTHAPWSRPNISANAPPAPKGEDVPRRPSWQVTW